jgi:diguanylate cyclase (GGDEF)-like protein/PAS domain S-box-containing protein
MASDSTLNNILDIIVEGTWDWDINTGHVTRSPGWYRMLGYNVGILKENVFTWENIIHPEDYTRVMQHFEAYITGTINAYQIKYRCKKSDGKYIWIADRGKIVSKNTDGSAARMIGAHHNIHQQTIAQSDLVKQNALLQEGNLSLEKVIEQKTKELAEKNQQLEKKISEIESISNVDPLTQVGNRKLFEAMLAKEMLRANRYHHSLALSIFDIDKFKGINDKYGHKIGDDILCAVSRLVKGNIRDIDLLARWGGDEFVIVFPEQTQHQAHITSEKLRTLICEYHTSNNISITCSFGVAQYQTGDSLTDLFQRVDKLLFISKQQGGNKVCS